MNPVKKQTILTIMANCPVVSTTQIARIMVNAKYPYKRASHALQELSSEKLIEGYWVPVMGKMKAWRLSKKGRELMEVQGNPIPFTSQKVDHYISLADIWMHLKAGGELKRWRPELRELYGARGKKYSADAFACIHLRSKNRFLFFESQLSPITSKRWAEKWKAAQEFFESPQFRTASFQDFTSVSTGQASIVEPSLFKIVVVSTQQPDTILTGSGNLPIIIARDVESVIPAILRG